MTNMTLHSDREYEAELTRLHEQLLLMGAQVEEMIAGSMRALTGRDSELARRMIDRDHQVNRLEVEIDELCLRILAKRQPVASDLRFITIALKLVTDLERIGDLVVNICERVIELNLEPTLKPYVDLPKMAETVRAMVRDALDAFVAADATRAREVIEHDRTIDAYYAQIFRELLTYMMEDPRNIYRAIRAQSIAKYLERIGDHATNLAEMVVFMVAGKDIRHLGSKEMSAGHRAPRGILFLCVANSARSQMAEGWARKLSPPGVRIWSAGSQPAARVNPYAVRVMREAGIDISSQRPKRISDVPLGDVDTVITLCAEEVCVLPPDGLTRLNWSLPDPAAATGSEREIEAAFRTVRDTLCERIQALVAPAVAGK
jgi:phosphate transport system protein